MARRKHQESLRKFFPDRFPDRFIVHLFAEGDTEVDYLQKIGRAHRVMVKKEHVVSSPVSLVSQAFRWAFENARMIRGDMARNRIWIVFDDDAKARDMAEVVALWNKCPELCMQICKIRDRNKCAIDDIIRSMNVGFMTPCIEIWGLMCLPPEKKDSEKTTYPSDRHKIQSKLHRKMPSYHHDGHPYFEVEKMTNWKIACDRADEWIRTFGPFPDCCKATRYAGIGPLVREIVAQ